MDGFKVKELSWRDGFAHTPLGLFYVVVDEGDGIVILEKHSSSMTLKSMWGDVGSAKAGAQQDFERRVRNVIDVEHKPVQS